MGNNRGRLVAYGGAMFAGKTTRLIKTITALANDKTFQVFKHTVDTRYGDCQVTSHDGLSLPATPIVAPAQLAYADADIVGIDEAQFFDPLIVPAIMNLLDCGEWRTVVVAGLLYDFAGRPFGSMPELFEMADSAHLLYARCDVCGAPAECTQRLVNGQPPHEDDPLILVAGSDSYTARCKEHHVVLPPRGTR